MKAMVFAAGLGTRLKPLTDTLPKALIPVSGKPLIEHVCRKLRSAGINEVVVNVHHFADKIEQWIGSENWICTSPSERGSNMLVQLSDESARLLETGGAILHARGYLEGCGCFLIHNVDILSNLNLKWFASQIRTDALSTLLVSRRKSSRQLLFDEQTMKLVGWQNLMTGQVRSPYVDIDPDKCLKMAFSGIHIMSDKVFHVMDKYVRAHGLDLSSDPPRFAVMDFYLWACSHYDIYGVCADGLELIDVGKSDTLSLAEDFVKRYM